MLSHHFSMLPRNREHFERFIDLMATVAGHPAEWNVAKSLMHGGGLAANAHAHYLPAARAYLEHTRRHGGLDTRSPEARQIRSRLASNSRRMYAAQRPVFNLSIDLLLFVAAEMLGGLPLPAVIAFEASPTKRYFQDRCWLVFKHAEQRVLAAERQASASR